MSSSPPPSTDTDASHGPQDLYLESYAFTTAAGIVGSVDRRVYVLLRDGRQIVGVLRTFDQFANLVLQDAVERVSVDGVYAEEERGVYLVRGENVVLFGELDLYREEALDAGLKKVAWAEAEAAWKKAREGRAEEGKREVEVLRKRGIVGETTEGY